jgi:hypothetical protein
MSDNPIQANINVDANSLKTITCTCGAFIFESVAIYKAVPSIYSPTGKPTAIAMPCLRCIKCGEVHSMENVMKSIKDDSPIIGLGKGN